VLRATEGITGVVWVVGENAPAFYYNMIADQDGNSAFAEALVTTATAAEVPAIMRAVQAALDRAVPEAQIVVRELVQGPPVSAPVELRFVGRDLAALREAGDRARAAMAEVPGILQTRVSLAGGAPKLVIALDEDRVALAGLDLGRASARLAAGLDGATGGSLVEGPVESPIRVRLAAGARASTDALLDLDLPGPNGEAIPLSALGRATLVPSESAIHRRGGDRVNLVQGFVAPGVLPEEALAALRTRLDAIPDLLPPGVRIEVGGDADARADTVTNLLATVLLVTTLFLATLVLALGSFRLAGIAVLVCVLAAGLSLLALAIFRYPFGVQALIGVIGSIGVSINAAIVLLSALKADPAAASGEGAAMRYVVTGQARHIVSTTVTTVGGFLPLILAGGGFWPPFAMAVAGGVLLSAVVSFYLVPPIFALALPRGKPAAAEAIYPA
jgi:multidrug efflux pump subunit AcrB